MHAALQRAQHTLSYGVFTFLFCTIALIFSTRPLLDLGTTSLKDIYIDAEVYKLIIEEPSWSSTFEQEDQDVAMINYELDADFTSVFNWNVKQVFAYLVVEYFTGEKLNEVVILDRIILRGGDPVIQINRGKPEYLVWDDAGELRGKDARISLRWNVIPYVGSLAYHVFEGPNFSFPEEYNKRK